MFTPVGNTIALVQPHTLVDTALPRSIALRVPSDNVSPSVSSAELNNNASGNSTSSPKLEAQPVYLGAGQQSENFSAGRTAGSEKYTVNAQTAFLFQLASGDMSPEVQGIFVQYEKLLSFANVKYKPSNAGKPVEPVSTFKTLLELEKASPTPIILESAEEIGPPSKDIEPLIQQQSYTEALPNTSPLAEKSVQAIKYEEIAKQETVISEPIENSEK